MTRVSRIGVLLAGTVGVLAALAIWYSTATESRIAAQVDPLESKATSSPPVSTRAEPRETSPIAPSATRSDSESVKWVNTVKAELVRRDDAESLIVAALLSLSDLTFEPPWSRERVNGEVELLKRASSRAPSNPAVQWLAWTACAQITERHYPCDVEAFARALRAADPKNAYPLVDAVDRARKIKDPRAESDALAAVESSGGFNNYVATYEPMLFNTVESARIPPPREPDHGLTAAQSVSIGMSATVPLPNLKPLIESCDRNASDPLAGRCLSIAQQLRNSDNYLARRIGLRIAERVTPFGSVQAGEISQERRTLDWLASQIGALPLPPEAMQRLLPTAGSEVELWRAWLKENNVPITPPVDWEKN